MTSGDALRFLPHGPEFRFLDRVVSLSPGEEAMAEYRVRGNESFLRGHFPGQPIFPGVLLIEAVAQLAGIVAQSDASIAPLAELRLTAVRGAKIFGTAAPGETLRVRAKVEARLGKLVQATGAVAVGDRVLLECGVTLSGAA